jgi:uncharacterized protein YbjT (DUF2867 family)
MDERPTIAVLGASGLIGNAVAEELQRARYPVLAIARRFTEAQRAGFPRAVETALVGVPAERLATVLAGADVVFNCLGVLQDGPAGRTADVHLGLVAALIAAIQLQPKPVLLIHVSIPGGDADDHTPFSRSKRAAEHAIAASGVPYAIVRPGFVLAPAAFGGSAMLRALAALPVALDPKLGERPFAVTDVRDIARTVEAAAQLWRSGQALHATWDVMDPAPSTVAGVVDHFRQRLGGARPWATAPSWLLSLGALAGDAAALLGWTPPVRSTALAEMRRGVAGDPTAWTRDTGLTPTPAAEAFGRLPATVQEAWFARLYLAKPLLLATLALFWLASGAVALGPAFAAATSQLTAHGVPPGLASWITAVTGVADIAVGAAIAIRGTCRAGLLAGIGLSLAYLAAATALAPDLWGDPLGPLVKVFPAIVLMLAGLTTLRNR